MDGTEYKSSVYYQRDVLLSLALDFHIAAKKCSFVTFRSETNVYEPKSR